VLLLTLKSLLAVTETQSQRLQTDAAKTHALLEATAAALSRGRAA
jgi:hypothetical protein